jgi:hypothetical protein
MRLPHFRGGHDVQITEGAVVQIARSFDEEAMGRLLDLKRNRVHRRGG